MLSPPVQQEQSDLTRIRGLTFLPLKLFWYTTCDVNAQSVR